MKNPYFKINAVVSLGEFLEIIMKRSNIGVAGLSRGSNIAKIFIRNIIKDNYAGYTLKDLIAVFAVFGIQLEVRLRPIEETEDKP